MPIRVRSRLLASSRAQARDLGRNGSRGRRGARAAAAVAVTLLPAVALTAGCSSGGKAKPQDKPGTIRASGAVSTARLTSALLTSSDLPHVQVIPAAAKTLLLGSAGTADDAACQPIVDQWSSQPKHPRQVYSGGMVTDTTDVTDADKKAKAISLTVIASYTSGTARSVLDELTTALGACRTFKVTRATGTVTTFDVERVRPAAPLGDQQATYTITDAARGAAGSVLVTVVRSGDTTAAYETVRSDHKPATLRPSIPLKQTEKLRKAATGD